MTQRQVLAALATKSGARQSGATPDVKESQVAKVEHTDVGISPTVGFYYQNKQIIRPIDKQVFQVCNLELYNEWVKKAGYKSLFQPAQNEGQTFNNPTKPKPVMSTAEARALMRL